MGDALWGVINIEETEAEPFDEDDARLMQTVADQVGAALRSATLDQQLDSAYVGTVQALARLWRPRTTTPPTTHARSSTAPTR